MPGWWVVVPKEEDGNGEKSLRRENSSSGSDSNPGEDCGGTTDVGKPSLELLWRDEECEMILAAGCGISACQLGQGDGYTCIDKGRDDDSIDDSDCATGCNRDGKT